MRGSPGGLPLIQELVRSSRWHSSSKVWGGIGEGDYTREDLEQCVATGHVHKKEGDERGEAVDGNKYTILGNACTGYSFYLVGKIVKDDSGFNFRIITAHERE